MPESHTRSVLPTRFSVPAGTEQDIKFCGDVLLAVTVTGVTFVQEKSPVKSVPLRLWSSVEEPNFTCPLPSLLPPRTKAFVSSPQISGKPAVPPERVFF